MRGSGARAASPAGFTAARQCRQRACSSALSMGSVIWALPYHLGAVRPQYPREKQGSSVLRPEMGAQFQHGLMVGAPDRLGIDIERLGNLHHVHVALIKHGEHQLL